MPARKKIQIEKNGDFDTVGVFYALKTENGKQEKIEINRFFREPEGDEEGSWTEISKEEYYERKWGCNMNCDECSCTYKSCSCKNRRRVRTYEEERL